MSASINRSKGFTIVELLVAIVVGSILIGTMLTVTFLFYGGTIKENFQSRLAVESGNLLRSITDELRTSSGVRSSNTISDPNAPGGQWTTSNASLVLIISTPVIDGSGNFVMNPLTGAPYQNEIVYFAQGGTLYKRYLANPDAPGNRYKTSCPQGLASASCPADVVLSHHFKDMQFVFYDQDDQVTTDLSAARATKLTIQMHQTTFGGQDIDFNNTIRITMRNSTS